MRPSYRIVSYRIVSRKKPSYRIDFVSGRKKAYRSSLVQVQEGAQLDDQDALPLCPPSAPQREEPLHFTVLQREPEAPPPVGQDLQKEIQLC